MGGLELGISQVLGIETAWHCEIDPAASKVLATRFPGVPNLGDITRVDWRMVANNTPVDVVTAGFPCQDVSAAGKRAGLKPGTRSGLWSQVAYALSILRPSLAILENVRGLLSAEAHSDVEPCPWCLGDPELRGPDLRALGAVLGDLADIGFDAEWVCLRAADVGAPHGRFRIFILAWPAPDPDRTVGGEWRVAASGQAEGWRAWADAGGRGGTPSALMPPPPVTADAERVSAAYMRGKPTLLGALLPTPTAMDSHASGGSTPSDVTLTDAVIRTMMGTRANPRHELLPTPTASQPEGRAERHLARKNKHGENRTAVTELLPTPTSRDHKGHNQRGDDTCLTGALLPTPLASDAGPRGGTTGYGPRDWSRGMHPQGEASLLPTPRATDGTKGGPNQSGSSGDLMLPSAVQPSRWGQYAPAVARWEALLRRAAPDPTELGPKGGRRLSPRFVEFLMGLPAGWVTGVDDISRNDQLKMLGNGVVPQQAAAAVRYLLALI